MIRTRFILVVAALLCVAYANMNAKTVPVPQAEAVEVAAAGSIKLLSTIFTPNRPATTPLLEWAKAATERARQERMTRTTRQVVQVPVQEDEDAFLFSRDRD